MPPDVSWIGRLEELFVLVIVIFMAVVLAILIFGFTALLAIAELAAAFALLIILSLTF